MPNRFQSVMAHKSDEQLNALLLSRRDYVPEALEAAECELRARGMSQLEMEAITEEARTREQIAEAKAELPLSMRDQVLYFVFSFLAFTPVTAFFYHRFADRGEETRSWMSVRQVLLGILFYVALNGVLRRFGYYFL